ncbi:MAG: phytanoyl-CoA dioxygenase family protein [Pseudomonadota bacterium]
MRKHKLNRDFSWQQPEHPPRLLDAGQCRAYREVGGFVLPEVFTQAEITALLAELDPLAEAANEGLQDLPADLPSIGHHNQIVFRAHVVTDNTHGAMARHFATHPTLAALCEDLIDARVRLYWDQLVYKYPGMQDHFPWHQDNGYTFVEPQQYLTCWVALTDATLDNGCPWIAPGQHLQGTVAHRWTERGFCCFEQDPDDALPMPARAGSVVVFSSLTPHRTGANLTEAVRKSYILQYAPDGASVIDREGVSSPANDPQRQFMVVPAHA